MRISYRLIIFIFFILYLAPIGILGFLVEKRIEERQVALQLYLKNQLDINRQIVSQRGLLREVHDKIRNYLLIETKEEMYKAPIMSFLKEDFDDFEKFWKRYETVYSGENRSFLMNILEGTQETRLISEEAEVVRQILTEKDAYFSYLSLYPPMKGENDSGYSINDHIKFLEELDRKRENIYSSLDNLADIRYIFGQRSVFFISGENERQAGFFTAVFTGLIAVIFILTTIQYFFIQRPFKDIMLFLQDLSEGKRGQRLYFSSPVKEIKKSEEIINEFVGKAEEHEKEK